MSTSDISEVKKFASLSKAWWDLEGPFKHLHLMNLVRIPYIQKWTAQHFQSDPYNAIKNKKILDTGCGGGILSVPLRKLGAHVTGIDATPESIAAAREYANSIDIDITYVVDTVENAAAQKQQFDVVCALEVLEHVTNIDLFLQAACAVTKKGGLLFVSTINKTNKSYIQAILLAEHILKIVPKGTHVWKKFIKPSTINNIIMSHDLNLLDIQGMKFNIIQNEWYIDSNPDVNYIMVATKL